MVKGRLIPRVLIVLAALFTVGWGVAYRVPSAQVLMLDFAASFLLNVTVMGLLGCAAHASVGRSSVNGVEVSAAQKFWQALAIAWALNIAGNIAWGVHDVLTSEHLGIFTWVDGIYLARYGMVGWALWHYPHKSRRWMDYATVTLVATALIWAILFRVMLPSIPQQPGLYFMGGALYPILDTTLIYAAFITWLHVEAGPWVKRAVGLFALAMLLYGAANWINFTVRAIALSASSDLAAFLWLLADGVTGLAAFLVAEFRTVPTQRASSTGWSTPLRWTAYVPYVASVLVLGIMIIDWIRSRSLDWMLITCTIVTLGITVYNVVISPSPNLGEGARG
jgi:hypothetical protein